MVSVRWHTHRFNWWSSCCSCDNGERMKSTRPEQVVALHPGGVWCFLLPTSARHTHHSATLLGCLLAVPNSVWKCFQIALQKSGPRWMSYMTWKTHNWRPLSSVHVLHSWRWPSSSEHVQCDLLLLQNKSSYWVDNCLCRGKRHTSRLARPWQCQCPSVLAQTVTCYRWDTHISL